MEKENIDFNYRGLFGVIYGIKVAKPIFESFYTDEEYGDFLGVDAWESIQHLDVLPDEIAQQMADSAARNKLIVETYKAKL